MWLASALVLLTVASSVFPARLGGISQEHVDHINSQSNVHWQAAMPNRFHDMKEFQSLLGAMFEPKELKNKRRPTVTHQNNNAKIPDHFDAREQWPDCESIREIRDQSACGSCWAFGATEAMTDRVCILSNGQRKDHLSALDLVSCCYGKCGYGCEGGFLGPAWDFWETNGIVTGGLLENGAGCAPYPFPKCRHRDYGTLPPCQKELFKTPKCSQKCQSNYTTHTYQQDKVYSKYSYNVRADEKAIQLEILTNGPVEAAFEVYEDFAVYRSGIYVHVSGALLGGHAIKIIGWDKEGGVAYWLISNSWNEEWGENGLFRIKRGVDECGIESEVVAGLPRL